MILCINVFNFLKLESCVKSTLFWYSFQGTWNVGSKTPLLIDLINTFNAFIVQSVLLSFFLCKRIVFGNILVCLLPSGSMLYVHRYSSDSGEDKTIQGGEEKGARGFEAEC